MTTTRTEISVSAEEATDSIVISTEDGDSVTVHDEEQARNLVSELTDVIVEKFGTETTIRHGLK